MNSRTCVVCRKTDAIENLGRFYLVEDLIYRDLEHSKSSRGAYCHKDGVCFKNPNLALLLKSSLERVSYKVLSKRNNDVFLKNNALSEIVSRQIR